MEINITYTVTIIVPFYNQENVAEHTICSLLKQEYPEESLNFIFIDDGSKDSTNKILKKFVQDPRITLIFFPENRGRSASRNAGIASANSELIGFLDGDMTVEPDWLQLLTDRLDKNVVGVMGDSRLPIDAAPNLLDRYFYSFYRGARQIGENKPLYFRWFLFNNTVIRCSALKMIGNFDNAFTTYGGEDTDLAIRLWEAYPNGLRFSSQAVSEHHHKREVDEFCKSMYYYGKNNLPILLKKYPQYKDDLGGDWIYTLKGLFLFNPIVRWFVGLLNRYLSNFFLTRYMVIDAVIRGARSSTL